MKKTIAAPSLTLLLTLGALLMIPGPALQAQEFVDVAARGGLNFDADGNYFVTGNFTDSITLGEGASAITLVQASRHGYVAKFDPDGVPIWAEKILGTSISYFVTNPIRHRAQTVDANGDLLIVGDFDGAFLPAPLTFEGNGNQITVTGTPFEVFVAKYSADGDILWAFAEGGPLYDYGRDIETDADGNVFVSGRFRGPVTFRARPLIAKSGPIAYDVFVAKYSPAGDPLWIYPAGGNGDDDGGRLSVDAAGNVNHHGGYTAGAVFGEGIHQQTVPGGGGILAQYAPNGDLLKTQSMTGIHHADADGNIYTTSNFSGTVVLGDGPSQVTLNSAGGTDLYVAKWDPDWNLVWATRAGGVRGEDVKALALDVDHNLYVTGRYGVETTFGEGAEAVELIAEGSGDAFVARFDADGSFNWAASAGGPGQLINTGRTVILQDTDQGQSIVVNPVDGLIHVGGIYTKSATFGKGGPNETTLTQTGGQHNFLARYRNPNTAPLADAGSPQQVECVSIGAADVVLDGSASSDPDSTPGTNDDIVSFEWYEGGFLLGSGETLLANLDLGEHVITLVVTDSAAETSEAEVTVVIEDTTPPIVTVSLEQISLWPPNHMLVDVGLAFEAVDACDPAPVASISSVTSDEPTGQSPDAEVDGEELRLRAQRDGGGDGRVYVVTVTATDASGNSGSASGSAGVSHNQGQTPVDSGQGHDATQ